MVPLAVDPATLADAGAAVVRTGECSGSVVSALNAALAGCAGMAGDDPAGAALGRSYDDSASQLVEAMATTRNGLCGLGDGVRVSAHNYSMAEAMSDVSGRGAPLAPPVLTGGFSAPALPSSVGATDGAPPGWGWVAPFIGMIWPTGDSGKLRTAAAAWADAGTQFVLAEIEATAGPMHVIRDQRMPEGPAIEAGFADAYASTTAIARQCQALAAQLNNYATRLDAVHAAILDLLARICDPMTGIKEVWDVLTDEDEDEIRKIANDIRTVIDNFAAEVAALRAQLASVLAEAATTVNRMEDYAAKAWALAFTGVSQRLTGVGEEAFGLIKGLAELSQPRLLLDPVGYFKSLAEVESGLLPLVGAGGNHAPGVLESWQELGKGVAHWDEWKTNPFKALGKTEVDLATMFLPGGPLSKLAGRSRRMLESLKKPPSEPITEPHVGAAPHTTPAERPPETKSPPKPEGPAPAAKPGPAPADSPAPHSPTESKPPGAEKSPGVASPTPTADPPEPAGGHTAPASPGKPSPPPEPHYSKPIASRPLTPPNGYAAVPAPTPAHTPQPEVVSSPPHTPPANLEPMPTHPPELAPRSESPPPSSQTTNAPTPPDQAEPAGGSQHDFPGGGEYPAPAARLLPEDLSALTDYTGSGYQELNRALRSNALELSHQARISALVHALEKLPAYNGAVVRGTSLPTEVLARYRSGEVITEEAFMSTTTNPAVAESPAFAGNVEFRILSVTGRDVSSVSMFPAEQEILFACGTQFYVVSKTVDPASGRTIIEMIER